MKSLLQALKHERRKAAELLRIDPADQSLRWTLADIQTSIAALEAVIADAAEEDTAVSNIRDMVIL
jgi:hypothetical protein